MAAVVTTKEIADAFTNGMEYFNTFGGNPVSCAIGSEVLDIISDEQLQRNAQLVGAYLLSELQSLQKGHPLIGDVRGRGLYLGIELVHSRTTKEPAGEACRRLVDALVVEAHMLVGRDGPHGNVLKLKPPLSFSRSDAARFVQAVDVQLTRLEAELAV